MKAILAVVISNALIENIVFARLLGMHSIVAKNKQYKNALFTGLFAIIILLLSTLIMYPIRQWLLYTNLMYLFYILISVILIAFCVSKTGSVLNKKDRTKEYVARFTLLMFDCSVLGVLLLQAEEQLSFGASMAQAFGVGIGFFVALVIFTGVQIRIDKATISKSFRGVPILLIAASIVSMVFMGFAGLAEGLLS